VEREEKPKGPLFKEDRLSAKRRLKEKEKTIYWSGA